MNKRVSIIIPCYKDSKTLARAINSIYMQTYRIDEILVVNDCSPETKEIESLLENYPEVIYIKNLNNVGLAATRNVGLQKATSEIVSFVDADDELHPQKIEFQIGLIEENTAVTCDHKRIKNKNNEFPSKLYSKNFRVSNFINCRQIIWKNKLTGASLLARRDLLLKFENFDETLRSCEDFDLCLRMLNDSVIIKKINLPLYFYYYNPHGLSNDHEEISYWELQVIKKYLKNYNHNFKLSIANALVLSFWLMKHISRSQIYKNNELMITTLKNIKLLDNHLFLSSLLKFMSKYYFFVPLRFIIKIRSTF